MCGCNCRHAEDPATENWIKLDRDKLFATKTIFYVSYSINFIRHPARPPRPRPAAGQEGHRSTSSCTASPAPTTATPSPRSAGPAARSASAASSWPSPAAGPPPGPLDASPGPPWVRRPTPGRRPRAPPSPSSRGGSPSRPSDPTYSRTGRRTGEKQLLFAGLTTPCAGLLAFTSTHRWLRGSVWTCTTRPPTALERSARPG